MMECILAGVLFRQASSSVRRPAGYVIWHQKCSTSQDGDFKSPKYEKVGTFLDGGLQIRRNA